MDTLIATKPAVILTNLPVAPSTNWPQYDAKIDEFVMTGPNGTEIFGATASACLTRYNDAMRVNREHETANGWNCHLCGIMQPGWAGDCLTCPDDHDKGADHD